MTAIKSHRHIRLVCWLLALAMILPLTPLGVVGVAAQPDRARTVLLFPVVDEGNSGMPDIASAATNALQIAISDMPGFECTEFSSTSPMVRRGVAEGRIRAVDTEQTRFDAARALTIGHALQVDLVVIASIQSYRSTKNPRSVEIILSGQSYAVQKNYDAETGEPVAQPTVDRAFGVVGISKARANYSGAEHPLMREAVDDAAYKAAQYLAGKTISQIESAPKEKGKGSSWVLGAVLLAVLAVAVGNSGGSSNSIPAGVTPPRNLTMTPEGAAVRLDWDPPTSTTQTVLFYRVLRRVDANPTFSTLHDVYVNTLPDALHPTYLDAAVISGTHTYRYEVIAKYQNVSTVSAPSNVAGPTTLTF